MGGDVTVMSEQGIGSSFFLWLPAAPVESVEPMLSSDGSGSPSPDPRDFRIDAGGRDMPATSLRAVADVLLGRIQRVLHAIVARLRSDPGTPSAHAMDEDRLEDHLASFLVELSGVFHHIDAIARSEAGEMTAEMRDVNAIQRVVAERHGAQRARLGWGESELRREFAILREELEAAVRRHAPDSVRNVAVDGGASASGEKTALEVLGQFIATTERESLESYRRVSTGSRVEMERGAD
jgi:hypothetical protein